MYSTYDFYDQDLNEGFVGVGPIIGSVLTHAGLILALVYLLGAGGKSGGSTKIEIEFIGSSSAALAAPQSSLQAMPQAVGQVMPQFQASSSNSKPGKDDITIPAAKPTKAERVMAPPPTRSQVAKAAPKVQAPQAQIAKSQAVKRAAPAKASPPAKRQALAEPRRQAKAAPVAAAPVRPEPVTSEMDELDRMEEALFQQELAAARGMVARSAPQFQDGASNLEALADSLAAQADEDARLASAEAREIEARYEAEAQRQEALALQQEQRLREEEARLAASRVAAENEAIRQEALAAAAAEREQIARERAAAQRAEAERIAEENAAAAQRAALLAKQQQEARTQALAAQSGQGGVGSGQGGLAGEGAGGGAARQGAGDQNLPVGQALQQARSIEQLRQMPGNPRPQYSEDERYSRMEGTALLLGFVTRSGQLTQVRMVQATGHSSLDQKTLRAVSQWKFHPGQEGWVKIPVIWNLDGDPAGRGGRLRTQSSQN